MLMFLSWIFHKSDVGKCCYSTCILERVTRNEGEDERHEDDVIKG